MMWSRYGAAAEIRNRSRVVENVYTAARMMWFRWFALGCAVSFATACGGAQPLGAVTSPVPQVGPAGLHVMVLPRPTPDVVRLSLWIDAGTRDATPPQLATVSAWAAARAGGTDVNVRVLPDGTEFWVECGNSDIESAIVQLARAIATRDVDAATLTALHGRLTSERSRQELDGRHVAARAALVAAVGDDFANELLPFGTAANDADVTGSRITRFLSDHFGPNRALLVAVGDTHADSLDRAIATDLAAVSRAQATRAARTIPPPSTTTAALVGRATVGWVAAAIVGKDHSSAAAALAGVTGQWSGRQVDARWLPMRGGTVGLLLAQTDDPLHEIRSAIDAIARNPADQSSALEAVAEDLASVSERVGVRFCAGEAAEAPDDATIGIGFGVALADGTRSGPEDEGRAQQRVESTERELQTTIDRAMRAPTFRGTVGATAANVVLDNGARIAVQQRASSTVAIAIRFLGGASEEHSTSHGRTAVLSLLSAQACEGLGGGALITRLNAIGATLTPVLDPDSFGLHITAPAAHWRTSLELVTHCALRPLLHRRVLRDAQARMLSTLSGDSGHANAALVAERLAATHPGTIAPWGGGGSALLDLDAVVRAHAQSAVGARVALAIVGDVPVDLAVAEASRRLASMPAGVLPLTTTLDTSPANVGALPNDGEVPRAVLLYRIAAQGVDERAARGFVALLAEELALTASITLKWVDAGAWSHGAWAAVGLEMPIETLDDLQATVGRARQKLASAAGRAHADHLMQHAVREAARTLSDPVHDADARARGLLEGEPSGSTSEPGAAAFEKFLATEPHYLVSRGRPAQATP